MRKTEESVKKEFIAVYDDLADSLFRHAFFRVSNEEIARDLVQDSFMKTWNHISKGNEIDNLKAFLYKTLSNLVIDYYRKHKSESLDNLLDAGFDPKSGNEDDIVKNAEYREIIDLLETIPPKDKDVIVMRYIEGLPVKEIASALDETENTVSVRLHRALEKVKKTLNSYE